MFLNRIMPALLYTEVSLFYTRTAFAAILMSILVLGLSACGGGGEDETVTRRPPPGPEIPIIPSRSEVLWSLSDECSDGKNIQLRFFQYVHPAAQTPSRVWPSEAGKVYPTSFGIEWSSRFPCASGQYVCYGAASIPSTQGEWWGRGLSGENTCTNCCATCPESGTVRESRRLICSGSVPTPPPLTPTPPPLTPTPPPSPPEYAAIYYGARPRVWAFGIASRSSASAAERAAKTECERRLGSSCSLRVVSGYANSCGAIAIAECPSSTCNSPAVGGGSGRTRREAEVQAIRACERGTRAGTTGTCRVATTDSLQPGVRCVGTAR